MTKTKAAASLIFITAIFLAFNNARAEEDPTVGEVLEQKTTKPKQSVRVAADKLPAGASKNKGIVVRARVTKLSPEQPASIAWRWGGEGLGGSPVRGDFTTERPRPPGAPDLGENALLSADAIEQGGKLDAALNAPEAPDRFVVEGKTTDAVYLLPGAWSRENPISAFGGGSFLTFVVLGQKSGASVGNTELEFEFLYNGQLLKRFRATGAKGNTMGVVVPRNLINPDGSPKPEFALKVGSLKDYVHQKLQTLKETPGMNRPVPRLYSISTDCYGFGESGGYAIRTSDPETFLAEFEILRWMGMNSTVGVPAFFAEQRRRKEGLAADFSRLQQGSGGGYPIQGMDYIRIAAGVKKPVPKMGQGCPYSPMQTSVQARIKPDVEKQFAENSNIGVDQLWNRTCDEIGCLFDGAPEGKAHQGCCPYCREAFREFVRADGRTPADFGTASWDDIRSTYGYWSRTYFDSQAELSNTLKKAQAALDVSMKKASDSRMDQMDAPDDKVSALLDDAVAPGQTYAVLRANLKAAQDRLHALEWESKVLEVPLTNRTNRLSKEGQMLLWYYSARFNCEASARTFEPLRDAYDAINERKRQALARGETNTPAATQPWAYSFALRGNTFLLGGHSLDFFNFYRHADNAFVYETSNRDWRIWQWDSYLCDVGRSLNRFMNKQFGIYVKAHRGAPVQRSLAAVARGVRMIYWYTYGPEYVKGDSFGGSIERLKEIGLVNRIIAGGEEVTYDSGWAVPAEVAIVRPLTSEYMSGSASYENAKWVHTALTHAHIPMDALDEGLLMSEDISRYKVIVISGCHIRRDVAAKLAKWVEAGGTLVTSGWGMARDESDRPLEILWPVFGLASRDTFDAWGNVPGYGGSRLGAVGKKLDREPPAGATLTSKDPSKGSFMPVVGREVLDPLHSEDVMATYADGKAAVVRHRHGKGTAWVIGTYAGVEYAWEPMINTDKDQKWFRADKRNWIAGPVLEAGVRPVVDATGYYNIWEDAAFVEGHMLRNHKTGALAVILINWAHHIKKPVTIKIREAGIMKNARSVATEQTFPLERKGDALVVTLPNLDEGDILLLTP
ncbi:MAG: hypothetical protein WCL16_03450 [bacterium]